MGDLELLSRHHGDTAVMALMKGGVQSPAQAQAELEGYLATWRDHGYGMWALYHKDDDAFISEFGLRLSDDGLPTRLRVSLAASWQGQGLAYRPDLDRRGGEAVVYEMTREMWLNRQAP